MSTTSPRGPVHEMRAPRRGERSSEVEALDRAPAADGTAAPAALLDAVHAGGGGCSGAGRVSGNRRARDSKAVTGVPSRGLNEVIE